LSGRIAEILNDVDKTAAAAAAAPFRDSPATFEF